MLFFALIALSFAISIPTTKTPSIDKYIEKLNTPKCSFTFEMCKTCKNYIVLQKDYCDNPEKDDQKCICSAFRGNWKIYFEDVEDTIRTADQACAYVCSNGAIPLETDQNTLKTGVITPNGSEMVLIIASLLMILVLV